MHVGNNRWRSYKLKIAQFLITLSYEQRTPILPLPARYDQQVVAARAMAMEEGVTSPRLLEVSQLMNTSL